MPSYNKVVYAGKTLIDLSGDTVAEDKVLAGYMGHKADGTQFVGSAFSGYPNRYEFGDSISDSLGNSILDSSETSIEGRTVYRKV